MPKYDPSEHLERREARVVYALRRWENLILLGIAVFVFGGALLIGVLKIIVESTNWNFAP